MTKTMVITGGAGFVGSNAADYFRQRGYEIKLFDNHSRASLMDRKGSLKRNWEEVGAQDGIERIEGDVRDFKSVARSIEGAHVVIHTAGQTAVTCSMDTPITDFEVNAQGTLHVLEAARQSSTNPQVIYCSTNKVYGDNVNSIPIVEKEKEYAFEEQSFQQGIPEDFPLDNTGHTPYGCSKLAGDMYVQDYAHTYDLDTAVFRMSCVYGPRQYGMEDQGWLAWFVIATVLGQEITVYGDGKQVRDVLYVTDLMQAFEAYLKSQVSHGVWNVGGGKERKISLLQLLEMIEVVTGMKPEWKRQEWRPKDQKVYVSDVGKLRSELEWKPRVSVREGLEKLVEWTRSNQDFLERFFQETASSLV